MIPTTTNDLSSSPLPHVRCFTFARGYFSGWIVRYLASAYGDGYAEIAPDDEGPHCYLYPNAVEGYEVTV